MYNYLATRKIDYYIISNGGYTMDEKIVHESPYIIEMRNITKIFPGIIANDNITLQLKKGEIHALLGENGAGKSTLMSVLFGLYQPEEGQIYKNGKPVQINNPMMRMIWVLEWYTSTLS